MEPSNQAQQDFVEAVWQQYAQAGRDSLPWRQPDADGSFDPYKILVSELMLQQTQVNRVIPKYHQFLGLFPSAAVLARAELGEVLRAWQGLGYNRRAKFLWLSAREIERHGEFPDNQPELVKLPGIGVNTAGAILAYAYNQPAVFVETNVRTVYLHHFFMDRTDVSDKEIVELVRQTLDREHPREFYWALMDYGTHLKATVGNLNTASRHYTKQSRFEGSQRQVRGRVLRELGKASHDLSELKTLVQDDRFEVVLQQLMTEGLVRRQGSRYSL